MATLRSRRRHETLNNLVACQATLHPSPNGRVADSADFAHFSDAEFLVSHKKVAIVPRVSHLGNTCGPNAIARFVALAVIFALNAEFAFWLWPRPHVSQEVFERTPPPLANRDATAEIVGVSLASRIAAPVDYLRPAFVFRYRGKAVGAIAAGKLFTVDASTAPRVAAPKTTGGHVWRRAALAAAMPELLAFWSYFDKGHYGQPTKNFPRQVLSTGREPCYFDLSHKTFLCKKGLLWIEPARVSALVPARFIIGEILCHP